MNGSTLSPNNVSVCHVKSQIKDPKARFDGSDPENPPPPGGEGRGDPHNIGIERLVVVAYRERRTPARHVLSDHLMSRH